MNENHVYDPKVNKNFLTSNSNGVIIVSDRVIKHARVNHTLE